MNVVGVLPDAFRLRPREEYLSAGWLDMYPGSRMERLAAAAVAYDAAPLVVNKEGAFALGVVKDIKAATAQFGQKIRIVHEPNRGLGSYVAVRQYRDDELELLALLADEVWADFVLVKAC